MRPNGIILVTGPTGSGKTTTLYAALSQLNDGSRNVLTVEDPIEYALDGIGQTQVNSQVGMTFAAGLRAILRQDPDVVMVGEIRDPETAEIAVHIKKSKVTFYKAQGCSQCQDIGYTGRLGIYEIVTLDDKLRAMIHDGASETELSKYAFENSKNLLSNGADKVLSGETSAEEVLRVCKAKTAEDL